jgi:hypothetical protein
MKGQFISQHSYSFAGDIFIDNKNLSYERKYGGMMCFLKQDLDGPANIKSLRTMSYIQNAKEKKKINYR